ncbi:ABC transporter permease [Brachybacterium sp. GPGPB12]|uniref:ABC transporter permease n=1 Tax=Brachybacterium sp. GPGPB12 TaxID=3023517 RepID=UPI0031344638
MSAHGRIAAAAFRQYSTYRMATAAGIFTNTVFGFIRASIMFAAIGTAGGELGGYTLLQAATYVWLGQAPARPDRGLRHPGGVPAGAPGRHRRGPAAPGGPAEPPLRPEARPLGVPACWPAASRRWWWVASSPGSPCPRIRSPTCSAPSRCSLAITVAFLADMMVNLAAFWLVETRGLTVVYNATMNLLSGFLIPIVWFPDWSLAIARATPFPSMIQTPIDTLSGRVPPAEALGLIGVQIGWTAVLALAAWAILRAGTRSLEVQGG